MIAVKQVELPQTPSDKSDDRQATVVQALKMESETLKDLDHPHIVQYLGFEETPTNLSMYVLSRASPVASAHFSSASLNMSLAAPSVAGCTSTANSWKM
jgi:serine/threonine protein kinase